MPACAVGQTACEGSRTLRTCNAETWNVVRVRGEG
jgi:hypothetical protein